MVENIENEKLITLKKKLSKCVNAHSKTFYNKELIISYTPIKKQILMVIKLLCAI